MMMRSGKVYQRGDLGRIRLNDVCKFGLWRSTEGSFGGRSTQIALDVKIDA